MPNHNDIPRWQFTLNHRHPARADFDNKVVPYIEPVNGLGEEDGPFSLWILRRLIYVASDDGLAHIIEDGQET